MGSLGLSIYGTQNAPEMFRVLATLATDHAESYLPPDLETSPCN
jgi:hypothetical protein